MHAEGIGWPPKKAGEQLSAKTSTNVIAVDFSPVAEANFEIVARAA
ncbi:Uncharacterized protein NCS13_1_1340 [Neochlamydia sp. S13]|nr:Uncharacterized protein NCS13_1_1340 [Neochlamydia sp. S13]